MSFVARAWKGEERASGVLVYAVALFILWIAYWHFRIGTEFNGNFFLDAAGFLCVSFALASFFMKSLLADYNENGFRSLTRLSAFTIYSLMFAMLSLFRNANLDLRGWVTVLAFIASLRSLVWVSVSLWRCSIKIKDAWGYLYQTTSVILMPLYLLFCAGLMSEMAAGAD